jgi:hypothetical protein
MQIPHEKIWKLHLLGYSVAKIGKLVGHGEITVADSLLWTGKCKKFHEKQEKKPLDTTGPL